MRFLETHIPANLNVFQAGDEHDGNIACHSSGIESMVNAVNSEYDGVPASGNRLMLHGDAIEAITLDDKRYDAECTPDYSPISQVRSYVNRYWDVRKKIIGLLDGNHPAKLGRVFPGVTKHICSLLDCPYGGYTAKMTYRTMHGEFLFKQFATHGGRSVNSALDDPADNWAARVHSLKRALKRKAADCLIMSMGHSHQLLHAEPFPELQLTSLEKELKQRYSKCGQSDDIIPYNLRYFINTGSFFRTQMEGVDTYAEKAQYDPVELGYYVLKIRDYRIVGLDRVTV